MKKLLTLLFVLSLFVGARPADACSVMAGFPGSVSDRYARSEIVFVGTVQSVIQDKSIYGDYRIQFETSKVYKGDFDHSVIVMAAGSSAACGYDDALSVFKKGTVWAIYADGSLRTSSVVGNTQYESVAKAEAELDAVAGPTFCTLEYAPVCGRKDTGIRCVTTPCDSSVDKTYGNSCALNMDKAKFLYEGECRDEEPGTVPPAEPKPNPDVVVLPTATTSAEGEVVIDVPTPQEIRSGWQKFWTSLKDVFFFWR
jgi:hypothetical protein